MADGRTVSINIDVASNLADSFASMATGFATISTAVSNFATVLNNVTLPPGLNNVISSISSLNAIKIPNVDQLATGLQKLSDLGTPPDLKPFVDELAKFEGISVPGVLQLANGIQKLIDTSMSIPKLATNVTIAKQALEKFDGIELPGLTSFVTSLQKLNTITINPKLVSDLTGVSEALGLLSTTGKLPNVTNLATSLQLLSTINVGSIPEKLQLISTALQSLDGITLPNFLGLVRGLQQLSSLDMAKVAGQLGELALEIDKLNKSGSLSAFTNFATTLQNTSVALTSVAQSMNKVEAAATKGSAATQSFSDRLARYAQYIIVSDVIRSISEAVTSVIPTLAEYDQALQNIQAITGSTALETTLMGKSIIELSSNSKFSLKEISDGMTVLGQAGFSASEIIKSFPSIVQLATGTMSGLSDVVDLVATALRVFNINVSDTAHVSDVFAVAVNKSKLTMESLRTAFNSIGPIAEAAGVSFEDVNAAMMVLSNSGQRASTIASGLKNVFNSLVTPNKELKTALAEAGVTMDDLDPKYHSLQDILFKLREVVTGSKEAFDEFGKRGATAILSLTNENSNLDQMRAALSESGAAAKMAATQTEGLDTQMNILKNQAQALVVQMGDNGLTGVLTGVVSGLSGMLQFLTSIGKTGFGEFIEYILLAATALGTFRVALLAINWVAGTQAFLAFSSGFAAFTNIAKGVVSSLLLIEGATVSLEAVLGVLLVAFNPLTLVLGALSVSFIYGITTINKYKDAIVEFTQTADKFSALEDAMKSYSTKVGTLEEGSKEYANANISLRQELLKTTTASIDASDGTQKIAKSAADAASSINPLTGAITDGGAALSKYNSELSKLQLLSISQAANAANKNLESQTSFYARRVSDAKDAVGLIENIFTEGFKSTDDMAAKMSATLDFSKAINSGKASFKEISDYINSLDMSNVTSQQQRIIEAYNLIVEKGKSAYQVLTDSGKINLSETVQQVELTGKEAGLSGIALQAMVDVFKQLQETSGLPQGSIKQWTGELQQAAKAASDNRDIAQDFINKYKELGGVLTTTQQADIHMAAQRSADFDKRKQELIDESNAISATYTKEMQDASKSASDRVQLEQEATTKKILAMNDLQKDEFQLNKDITNDWQAAGNERLMNTISIFNKMVDAAKSTLTGSKLGEAFAELIGKTGAALAAQFQTIIDPKILAEQYKIAKDQADSFREQQLLDVQKGLADQTKATLDGTQQSLNKVQQLKADSDKKSTQITLDTLEKTADLAQENYDKISNQKGTTPEQLATFKTFLINAQKAEEQFQVTTATTANNAEIATTQKLIDEQKKREQNQNAYNASILSLENNLVNKKNSINTSLLAKETELANKRVAIENKANSDLIANYDNVQNKITSIHQRGMSEFDKSVEDYNSANMKLADGLALIQKANETNDTQYAERAKKILGEASNLFASSFDSSKAEAGVKAAGELIDQAILSEEKIGTDQVDKEKEKYTALANSKIALAEYYASSAIAKENVRHNNEVSNIEKEIALLGIKNDAAAGKKAVVLGETPSNTNTVPTGAGNSPLEASSDKLNTIDTNLKLTNEDTQKVALSLNDIKTNFEAVNAASEKVNATLVTTKKVGGDLSGTLKDISTNASSNAVTFAEAWEAGMNKAKNATQSWQSVVADTASKLPDMFSSGFTSAIDSFIDHTKTAGEAFQSFTLGILRNITDMIGKVVAQKAFSSLMDSFGGSGSSSTAGVGSGALATAGTTLNTAGVSLNTAATALTTAATTMSGKSAIGGTTGAGGLADTATGAGGLANTATGAGGSSDDSWFSSMGGFFTKFTSSISGMFSSLFSSLSSGLGSLLSGITSVLSSVIGSSGGSGSSGSGIIGAITSMFSAAAADGGLMKAYAPGGRIAGFSPHPKADNIPIWATAGEFMQPVRAVQKYGLGFMEAIRTLQLPTGVFNVPTNFSGSSSFKLAEGGTVPTNSMTAPIVKGGDTMLKVVNVLDKNLVGDMLNTPDGHSIILNIIHKHGSEINAFLKR